jgi:hypothetical protein
LSFNTPKSTRGLDAFSEGVRRIVCLEAAEEKDRG